MFLSQIDLSSLYARAEARVKRLLTARAAAEEVARRGVAVAILIGSFAAGGASADEGGGLLDGWGIDGRLQLDGAQFAGDNPRYADSFQVRRARVAVVGRLLAGVKMKLEYEFSGEFIRPKSLYLRRKFGERTQLTVGHFKVPVSLQTATSSLNNTFMERSLMNVGTTGYRLGAMVTTYGDFWSASSGVVGGRLSERYDTGNEGVGFFVRGVLNPVRNKEHLWHLGFGTEIRRYGDDDRFRLRSRPESDLTDVRLVDTRRIRNVDQSIRYNAEFAWKRKSFSVQAEYTGFQAKRSVGPDLDFSGWYAQAGWFLTGESRRYNRRMGRFRKTIPNHRFGAWEVAVRYSELDLNSLDVLGGEQSNRSVALNWYASRSLRFSLNYIDASSRRGVTGAREDVSIVQGRFQFVF